MLLCEDEDFELNLEKIISHTKIMLIKNFLIQKKS